MEIGSPAITRANCSRRLVPAVERGPSLHKMTMYLGARSVLVHVKTFRSASRDNLTFVIAYRARRRRSLPFLSFAFPPPCIRLPQLRSRPPLPMGWKRRNGRVFFSSFFFVIRTRDLSSFLFKWLLLLLFHEFCVFFFFIFSVCIRKSIVSLVWREWNVCKVGGCIYKNINSLLHTM